MTLSEYQIPKRADRGEIYANGEGIWWSGRLKRWIVTDAGLIANVLRDSNYRSHSYDVSVIEKHFGLDLRHSRELTKLFPLAYDGERHRHLRKRFSAEIAANTEAALEAFQHDVSTRANRLLAPGNRFCAMQDLLRPTTRKALLVMAGLGSKEFEGAETTPALFDDTITLRRRAALNALIGTFFDSLTGMPEEERYFRIGLVVLGANTLLGSLANSLAATIARNEGVRLDEIHWDADFCETGLAVIEKVADADGELQGRAIRAGDRFRIYLDAAGFRDGVGPTFSDLYFAVGPHKCPGMNLSRRAWRIFAAEMSRFPLRLALTGKRMREPDNVFNFPEQLDISVHE